MAARIEGEPGEDPYPDGLVIVSKVAARRDENGAVLRHAAQSELHEGIEDNPRTLDVGQLAAVNLRLMTNDAPDDRYLNQLGAMARAAKTV